MIKVELRPHTALTNTDTFKFERARRQQYKRTACSFRANTPPVRRTKINAESRTIAIVAYLFRQHMMGVRLQPHTASNANDTVKLEHKRSNKTYTLLV